MARRRGASNGSNKRLRHGHRQARRTRSDTHYLPRFDRGLLSGSRQSGRDGKKAYAVLLYDKSDKAKLLKRIAQEFPNKEEICRVYEHIAYYLQIAAGSGYGRTFHFEVEKFSLLFHHYPVIVNSALKILSRAGYIEYDIDPDSRTRVKFTLERDQLYMLHETTPNEELVITTLLREYSGLFVDYHFIELAFIAHATGLTQQQVYLILTSLSQRRILHFIPERSVPLLTYTQDRMLPEEIVYSRIGVRRT